MFRRKRSSERRLKVNRSKKRTKSTQDDDDDDVVFLGGPGCLGTSAITQYVTKTSSVPSNEPSYQPVISGQSQPVSRLDHRPLALRTVPRPMVTARRPPRHTAERTPPTVGASYTSVYAARPAVSRFRPSTYTLATSVDQTAGYRTGNRELYN
eukprot:841009_1